MVEVIFDDGKYNVASKIYAYDYGQKLRIWGLQLPEIVEAHFSRCGSESALLSMGTCEDNVSIIPIPDAMFTAPGAFRCAVFIRGDGEGESAYVMRFEVLKRPGLPAAVTEPTEREISYFESVLDAMRVMLGQAGDVGQGGTGGETIDSAPTEGSTNPVTSGGVYAALEGKAESYKVTVTCTSDSVISDKTFSEIKDAINAGKYIYVAFQKVQDVGGEPTVTETQYMSLTWCWDNQYIRFSFLALGNDGYTSYFVDFWPEEEAQQYGINPVDYGFMTCQFASKTAFETLSQRATESFRVNIASTYNDSTQEYEYSCDKTYSEILAAATNGKYVYAYFDRVQSIMPMVLCGPQIWFGYSQGSSVVAGKTMGYIYIIITSDGILCNVDNVVVAEQSALTALEQRVAALEQAIGNT